MKHLLIFILLVYPVLTSAQELHSFSNGEVADAEKINENFQTLDERLTNVEATTTQLEYSELNVLTYGWQMKTVDCSEDPSALTNEIIKGASLLHIKLIGTCEVFDFQLAGQKVLLDGGERDETGECAGTIRLISTLPFSGFSANSASVLYMRCLTLEAEEPVSMSAYSGSYIRIDRGVTATSGISFFANYNSLIRANNIEDIDYIGVSGSSRVELLSYFKNLSSVDLGRDSAFRCRGCPYTIIDRLTLTESSSATFDGALPQRIKELDAQHGSTLTFFYFGDSRTAIDTLNLTASSTMVFAGDRNQLLIEELNAKQGSSLIFPNDNCEDLVIENANLLSNAMIFQGSDGNLSCDSGG